MNKPKILFVGPLPPPYSGPELSMKQLLEADILNSTFHILFLKTNFRKNNIKKGKLDFSMARNFFLYFSKLLYLLIFHRPKIVYYPVTPTEIGWLGRDALTILIAKLFRAKVIIHLRGSHFRLNFQHFHEISKIIIGYALKKVNLGIVQANYLREEFQPFLQKENVKVLYQSIIPEEFKNDNIGSYEKGKILIVGHLTKAKGFTDIVKAIPEIATEFPYVKFCFAGNIRRGERGVFYNQVTGEKISYEDPFIIEEEIKKSEFHSNYSYLGIINGEKKIHHFNTCDIFLSASYSEGFSRSLLEAMAIGKPLIYTPVGAHREVLNEENGISISPGNKNELILAIRNLLSDTAMRNKMVRNNFKKARSEFSIEHIAENFKLILLSQLSNEKDS